MINTTAKEDEMIREAAKFGGLADDLIAIIEQLNDQLNIANDEAISLRQEVADLKKAQG